MISLASPIESVPKISKKIVPALKKLGIKTIRDLLFHFPARYEDFSQLKPICDAEAGEIVTIQGIIQKIANLRTFRKRMMLTEAVIKDDTGNIKAIWFNQPFLAQNLRQGNSVSISGKAALGKGGIYLQNPSYEKITNYQLPVTNPVHTGGLVPIYPETRGITSRWLRFLVKNFIDLRKELADPLPPDIRRKHNLSEIKDAIHKIHFPKTKEEAVLAKRRFVFEELLLIQLRALGERLRLKQYRAPEIPLDIPLVKKFVASLPFRLTDAQRRSIWEILQDIAKDRPMNRLLEGDVGSGKTVIAAAAALLCVRAGYKVAFMAPTEILANQHYETLSKLLQPFHISIGLLTGSAKKFEKHANVIVGTHALIQKNARFSAKGGSASGGENLGLVVIDEQHRFGVNQRMALVRGQTQTKETRTNADRLLYEDVTYKIRGCVFKVKDEIGLGHKEQVYQKALAEAFELAGLAFAQESQIPIFYNGKKVGSYQPDFVVEDRIIVELKALPFMGITEKRQVWTYVKGSSYKVALLVNFSPRGAEIDRIVYDTARGPRESALEERSPRESAILIPHFLSMSATPIPRTLALTIYGDLDLSLLDEMPKSRKEVITKIVEPARRQEAYRFIQAEAKKGKQVFVVCPRIELGIMNQELGMGQRKFSAGDTKAVKEEYEKLSKQTFPDLRIGMLHGKMKSKEKDAVMKKFKEKEINILVSTSVIEVGVDIPNATIMMIEGAERFGLAQLHQFRGRVGRGAEQSYCFLFPTEPSNTTLAISVLPRRNGEAAKVDILGNDGMITRRLRAVVDAESGFELAEKDLEIRGAGDIFGTRQWGVSSEVLEGLTNPALVREVRKDAVEILQKDPELKSLPLLRARLQAMQDTFHRE